MAVTVAFLADTRALIVATPEYVAFRAAVAVFESAGEGAELAKWYDAYGDNQIGSSPCLRLRKAIREIVLGQGTSLSVKDKESAYASLDATLVDVRPRPSTYAEQRRDLADLALERAVE